VNIEFEEMLDDPSDPDEGNEPENQLAEAVIPPELIKSFRFDDYEKSITPRYSMRFVFNGKPYHFDGVVTALAAAHQEEKIQELRQFAALPGYITRLCYNFSGVRREYYRPEALVCDSKHWVNITRETTDK
jgi:hypothetical protein